MMSVLSFRALAAVAAGALLVGLTGCESGERASAGSGSRPGPAPLVDAAPLVAAYNARADRFESLWARASVVIEGEDAEGSDLRERAEGHLQIVPPNNVALSLGKLGETNLYFGSNDEYYWWFDMIDSDAKTAQAGRHEAVTPEKIDRLGLPIHPLDLIETLGVTPLPDDAGRVVARRGPVPATAVIAAPTRRGIRRVTLDTDTAEPRRIELIGAAGRVLLDVELDAYRLVSGLDSGEAPLRVPGRVRVLTDGFDGEIRISLHEPSRRDIRPVAFDPITLYNVYGIETLYDLDLGEAFAGPGGE